jgi:hypothetical protein
MVDLPGIERDAHRGHGGKPDQFRRDRGVVAHAAEALAAVRGDHIEGRSTAAYLEAARAGQQGRETSR